MKFNKLKIVEARKVLEKIQSVLALYLLFPSYFLCLLESGYWDNNIMLKPWSHSFLYFSSDSLIIYIVYLLLLFLQIKVVSALVHFSGCFVENGSFTLAFLTNLPQNQICPKNVIHVINKEYE